MAKNSMKPQIRFKGFTDAWEQRKLGEEVDITMGQSPDGSTYREIPAEYILVQGNADLKDGWVFPRVWTTQKTKTAEAGDLIMSVRAPAGAMGKTAYNVVLGRGVAAIKGNEFIFQTLVKMDLDGYWKKLAAGSTFESINSDTISNAVMSIPQQVEEQSKIGDLFESVDNLITLHQRKYEKFVNIKKALLEKMFPQGDEKVPRIRFKGFTDAWEQRKLSEIVSYTASALSAKDVSDSGCYDLYDANSVIGKTNDGVMDHEYITIIKDGAGVGRVRILPAKTAFIGTMGAMTAKNSSLSFVYAMLCSTDLSKRFSGSTIPHIYFKDYGQEQYCVPELCEQDKIAAVFSDIDNLITLHQRQVEKLKNIKSALLEKMFV